LVLTIENLAQFYMINFTRCCIKQQYDIVNIGKAVNPHLHPHSLQDSTAVHEADPIGLAAGFPSF
jgi:hypothetical protein